MKFKQWIFLTFCGLETAFAYNKRNCPYKPICGTDGVTYASECEFRMGYVEKEDLQIMFDGPCNTYKMMTAYKEPLKRWKARPRGYLGYREGHHVADSAVFFNQGPLHGIADQNAAEKMSFKSENPTNLDGRFNWYQSALGWSSISKK